ncbi:MAG: VCBS repeat-containing protein [Betaproteobacteria bacterium]|nr:VCBS repeat-containing protein [Betaproteobacteria bacterium]
MRGFLLLLASLALSPGLAHAQSPIRPLVTGGAAQADAPASAPRERAVVRSRAVTLNPAILSGVQADARRLPGVAQEIGIEFFPEASFVIVVVSVEPLGDGSIAFHGRVSGLPSSTATIVVNGDVVVANVSALGRLWQLRSRGHGSHDAREVDASLFVDHGQPPIEVNAAPKLRAKTEVAADDGSLIDVMVLYTPAARAAAGGAAAMNAVVNLGITETNQAYASGGSVQRVRLVYKGEISYTETGMFPDLSRLSGDGDGFMDQAHALRNAHGADIVSLWGVFPSADGCGLGYQMATESSGFESVAFNVVAWDCATGNYSFGHEMGHNMGLRHDSYVDAGTNTINGISGLTYAKGYVDTAVRKRTIMAYNNLCAATPPNTNCSRERIFSTPNASFPSTATVAGNAGNGNATLALDGTRDTVANFRQTVNLAGSGVVQFLLPSVKVGEAAGSISITVARLAGATGSASVNWATGDGTALNGVHYTASNGTLGWDVGEFSERTIVIPILQNTTAEPAGTFSVTLSGAVGTALGAISAITVSVLDDEPDVWPAGACAIPAGFENGTGSVASWTAVGTSTYQGTCALESGPIGSSATGDSILQFSGTFAAGNITFARRVSSYPSFGDFEFLIDGAVQASVSASGAVPWSVVNVPVTPGAHTIQWKFRKELAFACANATPAPPEGFACADRAWIDNLVMPIPYSLTVSKTGTGLATVVSSPAAIDCGVTCLANFAGGTMVTLTAIPSGGSAFNGWSGGGCSGTGTCVVTMAGATSVTASFTRTNPAVPDFNADGKPDIIWSNTASGATYVWRMNGPALLSDSFYATIDPSWKIQGVADFNGDGHPDIVWRNTVNGNCYVWYTVNGVFTGTDAFLFSLPPEWVIQGVADFNGDGHPDFLMRNVVSGNAFAWFFNDNVAIGDQFFFNVDPSWKVEGVADLNADGQPDLLFRNMASGLGFAWNTQFAAGTLSLSTSSPSIFGIDPVWEVVQIADWNGDGKPDLLFRNAATGLVFVWYLNGITLGGSDFVTQIDPSWEIVPRR